jgi:hypothetical protein
VANNSQFAENSTCVYFLNSDILNQDCLPDLDFTITTPGSYELTYSFTVNTASADTVIFIEVFAPPVLPALTYNATSYEISCDNCGSNDYVWYFEGEELVGSDNGPIGIFFNDNYQNGHYSVVAENSNGCTTNSDELLLVQPIFFTNVTEACAPLTLTASDLSSLLPGTTMTIDFGDGSLPMAFENAQTHSYVDPGNFTIVVAATLDGVTGTYSQPIEVFEVLTPILEHDFINHVVVCSNCDQFEGVEWNIDGTTFNGIGPFSDAAQLFTVTGITVNGCSASALMLMPGVGETNIADLQIYPVPADEHLILQSKGSNVKLNYVTDLGGRIIEVPIKTRTNGLTLNTSSLPAGLYSMSIQVDGQTINRVISITH